ncbi:VOC family protein [Pendulispora albinea]|uniref:VOC family protein n=1 Tax=Pendulispora albinea TaxID=2741071 RepID=A0ABZ2LQB8_9BACT
MPLAIDHLVVAARTLDEGAAWVASRLGIAPAGGGKHPMMGTHNRVLSLGRDAYLEVIAIDPDAPPPPRRRWFALDAPAMQARLEAGPALVHWVARTTDIERDAKAAPVDLGDILDATRGNYRWRITVPRDGSLPMDGAFPTLIQWGDERPATALPDSGYRLSSLTVAHPRASAIADALRSMGLAPEEPLHAADAAPGIAAQLHTPSAVYAL